MENNRLIISILNKKRFFATKFQALNTFSRGSELNNVNMAVSCMFHILD